VIMKYSVQRGASVPLMNMLLTFKKDVTDQDIVQNERSSITTTGKMVKSVIISTTATIMNRDQ
jgi:hypothetical protein